MNAVGRKRMLKLIDFLKRLKANKVPGMSPKRFDMRVWRATGEGVNTPCGTVACAVGHIPDAMPRSGFEMFSIKKEGTFSWNYLYPDAQEQAPKFKRFKGWAAVNKFFEIHSNNSYDLFEAEAYRDKNIAPTLTNVIKRLERFVSDEAQA